MRVSCETVPIPKSYLDVSALYNVGFTWSDGDASNFKNSCDAISAERLGRSQAKNSNNALMSNTLEMKA